MASILPALILSPWLVKEAHTLLLEKSMLQESLLHTQVETRLSLEIERLSSVLVNKSDPMGMQWFDEKLQSETHTLLTYIVDREPMLSTVAIYNDQADILDGVRKDGHSFIDLDRQMALFAVPMRGRQFIGTPTVFSDRHDEFTISVPIFSQQKVVGVLVASIPVDYFWRKIRALFPHHLSRIYLLDSRGTLLMKESGSSHQVGDLLSDKAIVRALLEGTNWQKHEKYIGFEGKEVFGIASLVPMLKWGIISEIPADTVMNPILPLLIGLVVMIFLLHAFFGFVSLLFTKQLLSPISDLAEGMKQATTGNYHLQDVTSKYAEIDALTDLFNGMLHEINQREDALQKLTQAMDQAGEAIFITDHEGVIEYVNASFIRITGFTAEDAVGQTPRLLNSGQQSKDFYIKLWHKLLRGEVWEGQLVDRRKNGELYPALSSIAPIYQHGNITHFIAIHQDMSHQTLLEEQLRHAQKMEALGTLVGGIAHDFNNMLAGITGNLYLARRKASEFPDVMKHIEKAETLGYRAGEMIAQLLAFARKSAVQMVSIPLSSYLKEAMQLAKTTLPENIELHISISKTPLTIEGDATQIQQMLMNLLTNAKHAVEETKRPEVWMSLVRYEANRIFCQAHPDCQHTSFAKLTVRDNGHGMSKDVMKNIFEPFFTTKVEGKGSGLGLSMLYGAMQTHGGVVEVESTENEGTAFHLYFPLVDFVEKPEQQKEPYRSRVSHGESILMVDDEASVRETTQEVLESFGYRVLVAADGEAGAALFAKYSDTIDLVLSDVVMPKMNGMEMAQAIRKIRSDVPFIFATGYDQSLVSEEQLCVGDVVLAKPLDIVALEQQIESMLSEK